MVTVVREEDQTTVAEHFLAPVATWVREAVVSQAAHWESQQIIGRKV